MEARFISCNSAALHTFEFTFPDKWSRRKIKAIPSRKPEVSAGHWNDVYSPADDQSKLTWPRRETVVMLELAKESKRGIYLTMEEVAPPGEEPVEIVIKDKVFCQSGDLIVPARPDLGVDMRQGPSGPELKPDYEGKDEDVNK